MPFSRPTLSDLRSQVKSDIATNLPGTDPLLRFSNLGILGDALAGLSYLHYGYLDWISKQAVPFTATDEFLEGWAALKGVTRKAASVASGTVTFSGTDSKVIPAGTSLVRGDGATFTTAADGTISSGSVIVTASADVAGAAGNTAAGSIFALGISISGIQSSGTAATVFTGGADAEKDDALRTRMLEVYQTPPDGGSTSDYVKWAGEVPGVTRAWCAPISNGPGTVVVYIMLDITEAENGGFPQGTDGVATGETRDTPATGDQLIVANYIYSRRPVTALVYVVAPVPNPVDFTITGLSAASADLKAAIELEIASVFLRKGAPGGLIDLSDIESAIAALAGTEGFVITSPSGNITNDPGALPTVGTITYP
ncbi:MAG TPA: baseplate J/gp47 family protein [Rhizomicrobium sp.]|jgi:uncharacterized phage protein gp47/JayE|nr:baseplate J/gp47 family protein [Rhizomicrobium sp.]